MHFLVFKVYHWFKPYTGEYFSDILPDLSFWQVFALGTVLRYITGLAGSTASIMSTLSRVNKKEEGNLIEYLLTNTLIPWVALLTLYLVKVIVF